MVAAICTSTGQKTKVENLNKHGSGPIDCIDRSHSQHGASPGILGLCRLPIETIGSSTMQVKYWWARLLRLNRSFNKYLIQPIALPS